MWKRLEVKLDQTNFPFYPTEDKVSPPVPSISPLDMWKKTKTKERNFSIRRGELPERNVTFDLSA